MASTLRSRFPVAIDASAETASISSSSSESGAEEDQSLPAFTPPQFTIKELLGCIPAHCFERSALKSFQYVFADFAMIAAGLYAASHIDASFGTNGSVLNGTAGLFAKWAAWTLYWVIAGFNYTGVWIIAHECGHQAFSTSKQLNNAVGLVLHSLVLVPYHAWRISHSKHHAATGHMTREEVFVPSLASNKVRPEAERRTVHKNGLDLEELLEDAPLARLWYIIVQQLAGWPGYLFFNVSGQDTYPAGTNHFDPASPLFDPSHKNLIRLSNAGLITVISALSAFGYYHGFSAVVKYYGIPYLMVNHHLVLITYLQHTDPTLPHYRAGEWNFQRGALCTMDRKMLGPVGPYLMHGICETHISHHLSSKIPHYHAWEATEALKIKLGEHYSSSDENLYVSLWKNIRECRYVEDAGEVVFYKDSYGRAQRRVEYQSVASDSGVDVL